MGEVVEFKQRPFTIGPCVCIECKHKWMGVVPAGESILERPNCRTMKGTREGLIYPPQSFVVCQCDCDLFRLTPQGASCSYCGLRVDLRDVELLH